MEKLAKVKKEEFEREESSLIPLRHYLMAHIVPTLTKGLIDVTRARPEDPIDFLVYIFTHKKNVYSFEQNKVTQQLQMGKLYIDRVSNDRDLYENSEIN